ncbi:amylo-alpha-1,6-glucosidase [Micromonospora sp. M12]
MPGCTGAGHPRTGKPVEVNALWINGLAGLAELTELAGQDADELWRRHGQATASFRERFPAPTGWLHDVLDAPAPAYPLVAPPCTTTTRCVPTSCWPGRCRTRRWSRTR